MFVFQHTFDYVTQKLEQGYSIESPEFYVSDLPWKIRVEPFFDSRKQIDGFGCYLECTYPHSGYSCEAAFRFRVLRNDKSYPWVKEIIYHKFDKESNCKGDSKILLLDQLKNPNNKFLNSDSMTIEFKLDAKAPEGIFINKNRIKENLQLTASTSLMANFSSLLESEDGADITFIFNTAPTPSAKKTLLAHKHILKVRSPVFRAMFAAEMQESKSNEIEIEDMQEASFKILISHIYTGKLDFPDNTKIDLDICKEVINGAEMYNFPELKEYAGMAMTEFVNPENAMELHLFAKIHKVDAARKFLVSYIRGNFNTIL